MKLLEKIYDNRRSDSVAANLRRKRLELFEALLCSISHTTEKIAVLDVGGTEGFWERSSLLSNFNLESTVLNPLDDQYTRIEASLPGVKFISGDARNMTQFQDGEFDIAFSNSVIEHVRTYSDQRNMASEVQRVAKRYFIQTPNRYFPIEPHFLFPLFQFLPISTRVWLVMSLNVGWQNKWNNKEKAEEFIVSIQLLNKRDFFNLFPAAKCFEEKFGVADIRYEKLNLQI